MRYLESAGPTACALLQALFCVSGVPAFAVVTCCRLGWWGRRSPCVKGGFARACSFLTDYARLFFFSPLLRSSRVSLGEWVGDWWGPGRYFCVGPSPPPRCLPSASVAGVEASGFIFFFPLVYEGSLSGFFFSTFLPECVGACFSILARPTSPPPPALFTRVLFFLIFIFIFSSPGVLAFSCEILARFSRLARAPVGL